MQKLEFFLAGLLVIFIKSCMYSHVIRIYIRVAAAEEEVVYEVVAEPQEPQGPAPQEEVRGESAQGPCGSATTAYTAPSAAASTRMQ